MRSPHFTLASGFPFIYSALTHTHTSQSAYVLSGFASFMHWFFLMFFHIFISLTRTRFFLCSCLSCQWTRVRCKIEIFAQISIQLHNQHDFDINRKEKKKLNTFFLLRATKTWQFRSISILWPIWIWRKLLNQRINRNSLMKMPSKTIWTVFNQTNSWKKNIARIEVRVLSTIAHSNFSLLKVLHAMLFLKSFSLWIWKMHARKVLKTVFRFTILNIFSQNLNNKFVSIAVPEILYSSLQMNDLLKNWFIHTTKNTF